MPWESSDKQVMYLAFIGRYSLAPRSRGVKGMSDCYPVGSEPDGRGLPVLLMNPLIGVRMLG